MHEICSNKLDSVKNLVEGWRTVVYRFALYNTNT